MFVHIPGLHNSDSDHWQSQFERRAPQASLRVVQDHKDAPECAAWVERIEATLAPLPHAALVLTGHSIGCMAIARPNTAMWSKARCLSPPATPSARAIPNPFRGLLR